MKQLDRKWIHIINIILGVIIVPYSILELIGVFLLTNNTLYSLVPIGLLLVWFVFYIVQVKTQKTLLVMIAVFINIFYIFFIIPKLLY
ncbi:hypothetical protein [Guptibacillus hwajinpoensis]|uniref:Type IV secretory pathway VirB3-like protein n=1 Tax=Guptibacillus hwajinpoensis TaxID=208199 RepID=A0ABU0K5N0_9BACL|nr:hypothetical protein [Alkalihalobacillus hemicentroti]MDQ0483609.1 type IV secretory pathway VirB3-like protein [Alkalihalobacillus hemicentroti]